jgi:GH25 family lysozyme M1 (1,4-beta-N-acetylmuramidase)
MSLSRRQFLRRGAAGILGVTAAGPLAGKVRAGGYVPVGMDVSHYQGAIDWDTVSAYMNFAIVKATEGTGYQDPYFNWNWSEMARVGVIRGAYHFARPNLDPFDQADFFLNVVQPQSGDIQVCLDLEVTGGLRPADLWAWVQNFVAEIQYWTGLSPCIYTSPSFWINQVGNPLDNLDCPLWIAHWGVSRPTVPRAWSTWTFWQYTSTGSVPGVAGSVDRDNFNGDISRLWLLTYP